MSDTPRTDDSILVGSNTLNQGTYVHASFARQLERELSNEKVLRKNQTEANDWQAEVIKMAEGKMVANQVEFQKYLDEKWSIPRKISVDTLRTQA